MLPDEIFGIASDAVLIQVLSGISSGMVLFIVASGLSLIFGVMRVINFAHGGLYMLGAFAATTVAGYYTSTFYGFFAALFVVPFVVATFGMGLEVIFFRRIYDKEHLSQLLLAYGLTLIIGDLVRYRYGGDIYRLRRPDELRGRYEAFGLNILKYDLFLIAIGLAIVVALWILLRRTKWGRILRASVSNPEMLSALGVNVKWFSTGVFMLGCWLAGLGGTLVVGRSTAALGMDTDIIVQAFAIVVIGGLGSIEGALIGALIVGVALSLGILWYPDYAQLLPFAAMAIILIIRPWGLFGKPEN